MIKLTNLLIQISVTLFLCLGAIMIFEVMFIIEAIQDIVVLILFILSVISTLAFLLTIFIKREKKVTYFALLVLMFVITLVSWGVTYLFYELSQPWSIGA